MEAHLRFLDYRLTSGVLAVCGSSSLGRATVPFIKDDSPVCTLSTFYYI